MLRNGIKRKVEDRRLRAAGMTGGHGAGIYTRATPAAGVGHYVYDPSSACEIHGRRPEAICDLSDDAIAREEVHGHAQNLSELGLEPEAIRDSIGRAIEGRRDVNVARRQGELERDMAGREGDVENAPDAAKALREEAEAAGRREQDSIERGDEERRVGDEIRERHRRLDRRYRIPPSKWLVGGKAGALLAYDLGVVVAAFGLIPGTLLSKVFLAAGLAVGPLSISVGLAAWLSAANHRVRFAPAAGHYALIAALFFGAGILLMIPFRAAAFGDSVIPALAFSFLSIVQIALVMSETASWMVWFDSKVGQALADEIAASDALARGWYRQAAAEAEHGRRLRTQADAVEREAARSRALLRREEPLRRGIVSDEEGSAMLLGGIGNEAILEGRGAANREAERREREGEAGPRRRMPLGT